jgi:cytoskeleton protein RodZ
MPAVGAYLRALRERQGVSIDEIARSTRVLHHYLEALESDDLASLPAPVFAKGFIRAYCQALGVPADEAITLYEQRAAQIVRRTSPEQRTSHVEQRRGHVEERRDHVEQRTSHVRERVTVAPAPFPPPPPPSPAPSLLPPPTPAQQAQVAAVERRDSRSRGAVLISFVLLVVMGAALYAVTMALQSGRDEPEGPAATQVAATPAPEPIQALTPEPVTPEPAPAPVAAPPSKQPPQPAPPAAAPSVRAAAVTPPTPSVAPAPASTPGSIASPYRLVARTTETTWIRVRTEDGRTTEETIPPNEVREWVSNGPFVLTIGNAGGVSLELNGRPVPRLGASGAVISRLVLPADAQ